ncbi:hypothetical protein A6E15_04080 [Natrinema saccharevitans]|uniref:PRC-barrel domain-containing protein n=1 Tax=Natrinema saccharevitans TaxID=301967 RepID=A0A1S8AU15_9EURY|nr:hypothetical protein [Natrinema saccharevitans]OLZ40210.1 hypothetical protein A6E15_04080 [Natrinema saccharevitans]
MCAVFSDDDVGKPVENATGETVGVVAAVEGDVAHVKPDPSAVESITSSLGWEKGFRYRVALGRNSVREITPDAVRLEGELPTEPDSDAGSEIDDGRDE